MNWHIQLSFQEEGHVTNTRGLQLSIDRVKGAYGAAHIKFEVVGWLKITHKDDGTEEDHATSRTFHVTCIKPLRRLDAEDVNVHLYGRPGRNVINILSFPRNFSYVGYIIY